MDAIFAALADPSRRTVLDELRRSGEATAGQLADLLPIARPGVSRHLRVLREAGLVEVDPRSQFRVYRLRPQALDPVREWLAPYEQVWTQRFDALHTEVARGTRERKKS